MWKKLTVMGIALIGTFTVVFASNNELFATGSGSSSGYNAGGAVTGRVNQAPSGITGSNIGMQKGDKVYIGVDNPLNNKPLGWQLLSFSENYPVYELNITGTPDTTSEVLNETDTGVKESAWFTMSTEGISERISSYNALPEYESYNDEYHIFKNIFDSHNGTQVLKSFVASEYPKMKFPELARPFDIRFELGVANAATLADGYNYANIKPFYKGQAKRGIVICNFTKPFCLPPQGSMESTAYRKTFKDTISGGFELSAADRKWHDFYFASFWEGNSKTETFSVSPDSTRRRTNANDKTIVSLVRPSVMLDVKDTVFATSLGVEGGVATISEPVLTPKYTDIYKETLKYNSMKLRIENSSLTDTTSFTQIEGNNGVESRVFGENSMAYLNANALANTTEDGVNTVSAIIFDKTGAFKYYKPLEAAKGEGKYALDLTGIPVGSYQIGIVNEVYNENSAAPAYSSKISEVKPFEIVGALNELTHTASRGTSITDYYVSTASGNVLSTNKVASVSTKDGVGNGTGINGIVYKLQPSSVTSNKEDYKSFTIPTDSGTGKPVLDSGKPYVTAKPTSGDFLLPGVYKYRVQAYDANANPVAYEESDTSKSNPYAQLNDGTIVKGIEPSQGLISEDITTVVYPHDSQITYTQSKDTNGNYYSKDDVNASGFTSHLGTLDFASNANMQKLYDGGYTINTTTSKLMKKGSTTEQISALSISADPSDKSKFYIDKNSSVVSGTYEFDAWIYFKDSKGDTALLKVSNQSLVIAPSLTYNNPDQLGEALGKDTYERKYDAYAASDNNENIFTLIASDKADYSSNSAVKYCIYDEVAKACATSSDSIVATLLDNGNGTAKVTAKAFNVSDPDIIIRSYTEDGSGGILAYKDIKIQINRSVRKMKWEGTGIGSLNSNVAVKDKDYELNLPYDSTNAIEYSFSRILQDAPTSTKGILALRHDQGSGSLSVTFGGNLEAGTSANTFKLTDKCTGTSCYIEVNKAQDDNFEAGTVKLYIVSEDLTAIENSAISWQYNENNSWKVAGSLLTLNYKDEGTSPIRLDMTKLPADITNAKIVYSLVDEKSVGTISVANKADSTTEGIISILQANQTSDNASVKAVITSGNYAQKIVTLPVKVSKLSQTIAFNEAFKELAGSLKLDESVSFDYSTLIKVNADTAGKGTVSYTVAGNPVDMLTNNSANSTFKVSKAGVVTITANLTDDKNYTSTSKAVTKTITFYDDAGLIWTQNTSKPEATNSVNGGTTGDADVNKEIGGIKIDGGKSDAYTFTVENTKHSDDSTFFSVVLNSDKKSGKIKILKNIDVAVLNAHATQVESSDMYKWTVSVKATSTTDTTEVTEMDIEILFTGAQPDISFVHASNKIITDTYEVAKNIDLQVKRGTIVASSPTLTISGYTSALTLNEDGVNATIKGANTDNNDAVRSGRKIEVKAEVAASGGYKTGTSDLQEIIIKKADHPTIDFLNKTLSSSNNVDVLVDGILSGNGKFSEDVTITPVRESDEDAWIIAPYTVSKGEAYEEPTVPMSPKGYLGTLDFAITATGDDNYKPVAADTKTTIEFTEFGGITYKPINVSYGDMEKNVLGFIVSPNPIDDPETVTYAYSGYDDAVVSIDADGNITPLKVGTTTLTFKRMDSADNSEMEQNIKVTVKPKDITIYVNDLHKKVGELVINDDYSIDVDKSTAFEVGDDVGILTFSCQDNNVEVTSLTDGLQGPLPKVLPITVSNVGGDASKKANYAITYKAGSLNVTQDEALESWISVLPKGETKLSNNWYNGDVEVKLNAISGSYSEISPDGKAPWASSFTVSDEGKNSQNISLRDPATLARATSITKDIYIDSKAPSLEKITAKSSSNKLEDILNALCFGVLFKPKTEFTITTSDKAVTSTANQVSGTVSITYSIFKIEANNSETELVKDQVIAIKDETGKIKISDTSGTYKVCTTITDLAGNSGTQSCASVKIGFDGMDITTGNNECPDLNLDFNDDGIAELNIDVDGDKIPDVNIDSDFDGKADINVDSDNDKKGDLNLVEIREWKPGMCSTISGKTYATMEGIEPKINVVIDNGKDEIKNQSPYLNIDTSGDMKADFNISFDGKEPYLNIGKVPNKWAPETDYKAGKFAYDTMKDLEPLLNMGIINDKYPSINVDTNKDGKADINIDTDGDGIPDVNIDGNGDGKADINIDKDNNGTPDENVMDIETWKPEVLVDGDVPYLSMELTYSGDGKESLTDNKVTIEKPNGSFLPNHSLKVDDVSSSKKDIIKANLPSDLKDKNVEVVYDVQYFIGEDKVQPGEKVKVKLPVKAGLRNPVLLVETADGSFHTITPKEENGFYVYETDFLGMVSILGDSEVTLPDVKVPEPDDNVGGATPPSTTVKGSYTGTNTGDTSNTWMYGIVFTSTALFVCAWYLKRRERNTR